MAISRGRIGSMLVLAFCAGGFLDAHAQRSVSADIPAGQLAPFNPPRPKTAAASTQPNAIIQAAAEAGAKAADDANVVVVSKAVRRYPLDTTDYSAEQTAGMLCSVYKAGKHSRKTQKLHQVTVETDEARIGFKTGEVSVAVVDALEKRRADAYREFALSGEASALPIIPYNSRFQLPARQYKGLALKVIDQKDDRSEGADQIRLTGVMRNTGDKAIDVPPLTLVAFDRNERSLAGVTVAPDIQSLAPGEEKPFSLRYLNPPEYAQEADVIFAPPFLYRARRDCEIDPITLEVRPVAESMKEIAAKGSASYWESMTGMLGEYSTSELNALALYFRGEAEAAYHCTQQSSLICATNQHMVLERPDWRETFVIADLLEAAWVATRAAEKKKNPVITLKAEAARKTVLAELRARGDAILARGGAVADGVAVKLSKAKLGGTGKQAFIEIAGTLVNESTEDRRIDNVMAAMVDRFSLPMRTAILPLGKTLKPGESHTFSYHLPLVGIPPENLVWQIRVGAMITTNP